MNVVNRTKLNSIIIVHFLQCISDHVSFDFYICKSNRDPKMSPLLLIFMAHSSLRERTFHDMVNKMLQWTCKRFIILVDYIAWGYRKKNILCSKPFFHVKVEINLSQVCLTFHFFCIICQGDLYFFSLKWKGILTWTGHIDRTQANLCTNFTGIF